MQAHPYQETIDSVDQIAKRCAPATCCVSGEYPTGLAGRRCVLSHSMFLRSTIHLGLVGEMHMHNGKKCPPHYRMERKRGATRGCRGRVDFCLPEISSWQRCWRWRLADQRSSDGSSGSWQVVASPSSPRPLAAFARRVTGRVFPRAGAGGLSPVFLGAQPRRRPRRLVPARKEEVGRRCGIPRQLMRVRAQLLFTSR